jgi:hypothetical protein
MTDNSQSLSLSTSTLAMAISNPGALGTIQAYISAVNRLPMLTPEQELALGKRLHNDADLDAARQLIVSHLRLVVSVARQYLGYGLAHADLIQEGNVGLMKAVKRFDPDRGVLDQSRNPRIYRSQLAPGQSGNHQGATQVILQLAQDAPRWPNTGSRAGKRDCT